MRLSDVPFCTFELADDGRSDTGLGDICLDDSVVARPALPALPDQEIMAQELGRQSPVEDRPPLDWRLAILNARLELQPGWPVFDIRTASDR